MAEFKLERPTGLFLSGGGALGAWQAGCLARLVTGYGCVFDGVAGFSAGSLNGMAYWLGRTPNLKKSWATLKPEMILRFSPSLIPFSLFSQSPLRGFLNTWIEGGEGKQGGTGPFSVIALCLETGEPACFHFQGKDIKREFLLDVLLASCAIPYIFPPVRLETGGGQCEFIDGGVIGKSPIRIDMFNGFRSLVIIDVSRPEDMSLPFYGPVSFFESKARGILCRQMEKAVESISGFPPGAVYRIRPARATGLKILDFDGRRCLRAFKMGEASADNFVKNN